MKNDRDKLDDLIDGALPGYSNAGPIDGLEERVRHRIQVAGTARRSPWPYRLVFAVPALAALFLAGIVLRTWWNPVSRTTNTARSHRSPEMARLKPSPPRPAPPTFIARAPGVIKPKPRNRTGQEPGAPSKGLPRQQYFPAPLPMTDEEHALVAWAGRTPLEARQAFLDLQKRSDEPVAIQTIQIQPLHSDGAQ